MEDAKPAEENRFGAMLELGPNHHFEYIAIHDQRIALIRSYTVWYFIGLPTSIAVFSFFIYFGLTIGNIPLIALGGIISSLISWVTYSISLAVDREVVGLYPRIVFLEILLGYDFYREYLRRSPRGVRSAERKWSTEGAGFSSSGRSKSPPACSLRSLFQGWKAGGCTPWTSTAGSDLPVAMMA